MKEVSIRVPHHDVSDMIHSTMRMTGFSGIFNILLTVACIWLAWRGLSALRLDPFLKDPKSGQAKLLLLLVSIALGYLIARFVLDYLAWSTQIRLLF